MAYKFQRGKAFLSGTLDLDGELTGSGNVLLGSLIDSSSSVRGVLDLEDADGSTYGLQLGGTLVTSTGTELNLLDGATAGVKVASKAVVYSSSGSLNTWGLTVVDGAYDLTVASHDAASNGLVLGSTLVTATAAELNYSDGISLGTGSADTVLSLDDNRSVTNILNLTASFISASAAGGFIGDGSSLTNVSSTVPGSDLTRGYVWIGDSSGDAAAVEALDDGKILIGDGTDLNSVAVSGDVTLANDGAVTIANNAVEAAMILSGAVTSVKIGDQQIIERNLGTGSVAASALEQAAVTMAAMATGSVENNAYKSGSIENGHIKNSTIANAKLAGSITGAKMNNAIFADLEIGAPGADGQVIIATGAGAFQYESGATLRDSLGLGTGSSPTFDDLNVTEATVSTKLTVTGFTSLSGNVDLGDGGGDTVNIVGGTLNVQNGFVLSQITYKGENYSISAGDYLIDAAAGFTMTLPSVNNVNGGTVFVIKNGNGDASVASPVTITGSGPGTIDGENSIKLESSYAAVTLVASGSAWLVL